MNKLDEIVSDKSVTKQNKQIQGSITCHKCGYIWETKSTMAYISCPSCSGRTKNPYGLYWIRVKNGSV